MRRSRTFASEARCRLWSAVTCHRFWQATCRRQRRESHVFAAALNAPLLCRQVGKAGKAVTSHRTPKPA